LLAEAHIDHGGGGLGEGEEGGSKEACAAREEETPQGLLEVGGAGPQGRSGLGLVWLVGVRGEEQEDEEEQVGEADADDAASGWPPGWWCWDHCAFLS